MNSVCLIGNLGHDPELRQVQSGKSVLNFRLAVDKARSSGNRTMNDTSWFDVTIWGAQAEHQARFLTKGSRVAIQGEINQRNWTDREGTSRSSVEIIAYKVDWIDLKERTVTAEATA